MDSNLNDNQLDTEFDFKQESLLDNNIINQELESKWREIEKNTQEKIKKLNEAKRLNDLNDFSIMRIDLNSLVHPIDDSSDFEDYCKYKIKQLEKMKQSIDTSPNFSKNLITFGFNKNDNTNININSNSNDLKSLLFDKDNEKENESNFKKNGKFTLNDLIQMNKNQNSKTKLDLRNLFDIIDNTNDTNKSSIINNVNNFENLDNIKNNSGNRIVNKFNQRLNIKRPTFLNEDNEQIINRNNKGINLTQKNKNNYSKYKRYFESNSSINNNYRTNRNIINQNKSGIKSKIEENYNYLYSLYPNLRSKNN